MSGISILKSTTNVTETFLAHPLDVIVCYSFFVSLSKVLFIIKTVQCTTFNMKLVLVKTILKSQKKRHSCIVLKLDACSGAIGPSFSYVVQI